MASSRPAHIPATWTFRRRPTGVLLSDAAAWRWRPRRDRTDCNQQVPQDSSQPVSSFAAGVEDTRWLEGESRRRPQATACCKKTKARLIGGMGCSRRKRPATVLPCLLRGVDVRTARVVLHQRKTPNWNGTAAGCAQDRHGAMIGQAFHWANLTVAFLLELCALAALGYWGLRTGTGPVTKAALGDWHPAGRGCSLAVRGAPRHILDSAGQRGSATSGLRRRHGGAVRRRPTRACHHLRCPGRGEQRSGQARPPTGAHARRALQVAGRHVPVHAQSRRALAGMASSPLKGEP